MWKEILVNNQAGIDEIVSLWNNRLDCTVQIDKDMIERVLNIKRDGQYYIFEGNYVKMLAGIKHDISDDTTYIFSINSDTYITELGDTSKANEVWNAYQLIIKLLLEKYDRKVKLIKWEKDKRLQSIIDYATTFYAQFGIIAVNTEFYWVFELM